MTKQDITYQDKLNELRLDISHPNSNGIAFILVEGETDIRLFRKLFDLNSCKVEAIPGGNPKVEDAVSELLIIYQFVIGLRDADFIHLSQNQYVKTNMFITDLHDIEMNIIFEDDIFNALMLEFTDFPIAEHDSIKNDIFKLIKEISLLKWLNEREDLRLKFDEIGFQHLLSFANNTIDFTQYLNNLMSKSPNARNGDIDDIKNKMQLLNANRPNIFQLCNGHDFIKAFSVFLRQKGKDKSINENMISSNFRISYNHNHYKKTNLYQATKLWADNNNCSIYPN